MKFIPRKVCQFRNLLYLCTRFREATTVAVLMKQDDPWQHSIQTSSTTWPSAFFMLEVITSKVRNEIRTVKNNLIYIIYFRPVQTIWTVIPFWGITDIIYNEEFDPGSGWTLATGLTHASRGVLKELASDRRPAHGWVTRIQPALHIGIASRKGD